jgi:hypothetical protein
MVKAGYHMCAQDIGAIGPGEPVRVDDGILTAN